MAQLFTDDSKILDAVDWSKVGFQGRNGYQSTIWVGSELAFTPCHQDTYGLNLVAQIDGVKKWLLLPPSDSHALNPLRVPYEESSIFTQVDGERLQLMNTCLKVGLTFFFTIYFHDYLQYVNVSYSISLGCLKNNFTQQIQRHQ